METQFVQTAQCVVECAGKSTLTAAALFAVYVVFNAWASTLGKDKWWEKLAHTLALNWGYLFQKEATVAVTQNETPPTPGPTPPA